MIDKIPIDKYIEKEYDLSNFGLDNHSLIIEEKSIYIENEFSNFFIEINNIAQLKNIREVYLIIDMEDPNTRLEVTKDQFKIIEGLISNEFKRRSSLSNS